MGEQMNLTAMEVNQYLELLNSEAPAPGGGAASALAGAQGIGLCLMVVNLTLGKERYAQYQEHCQAAKEQGLALYQALTSAINEDAAAFTQVSAAFQRPKETEEQQASRKEAIAKATLTATEVPYRMMEKALEGLELTKTLIGKSNPNVSSDLGVAALNLSAAVKGAWLNVKINLPGIKDQAKAQTFHEKGQEICIKAEVLAMEIYACVLKQL